MVTKYELATVLLNRKSSGSGLHGGDVKDYIDKAKGAVDSVEELYMLLREVMQLIQRLKQLLQSKPATTASTTGSGMKSLPASTSPEAKAPVEPKSSGKKQNPWMAHVAQVKKDNPSVPYREILALAKKSYNKPTGSGKCGGAVAFATTLAIASAAKAIAPPLERILKDSGVLNFYSNVSGSIAKKFSQVLADPSRAREKNIIVNVLPKLVRQYERLENIEANKKITEKRKRQIAFKKSEIASEIRRKLANVQGIREIRELNDLKPAYIEQRSQPATEE